MASTRTEFVSRIVLRAVVFISLSVAVWGAEARRCYWCGPLAEQVHRSARAPPCSASAAHVTVCDEGFPHCAVVATYPPLVESRYCVKFYQDECYSLYCNSTKTWRMTCPCRGDLCNGPNTEREDQAFAHLPKLAAKYNNARIKRALMSGFIKIERRNNVDTASSDQNQTTHIIDADTTVSIEVDSIQNYTAVDNQTMQNPSNNTVDDGNSHQHQHDEEMQSDQPMHDSMNVNQNTPIVNTLSDAAVDAKNTNADENKDVTEKPITKSMATEMINKDTTVMATTTSITTVDIPKEIKINDIEVKPSEQMPPAEALQHNEAPVIKTTERTTMDTTATMSTRNVLSTEFTKPRNNTASQINNHILAMSICIILHY